MTTSGPEPGARPAGRGGTSGRLGATGRTRPGAAPGTPVARATHATIHAVSVSQPDGLVMARCGNVLAPFWALRLLGAKCPVCFPEAGPAFVCSAGHRTPYHGGPLTTIPCPHRVSAKTWCSRNATLGAPMG